MLGLEFQVSILFEARRDYKQYCQQARKSGYSGEKASLSQDKGRTAAWNA
jgi:hypothetical protein